MIVPSETAYGKSGSTPSVRCTGLHKGWQKGGSKRRVEVGIKVFLSYHAEKDIFLGYALEMAEKFLKAPKG